MSSRGLRLPIRSEPDVTEVGSDAADAARRPSSSKRKGRIAVTLPSVNLLSPWALERIAVRRLRIRFMVGCLGLVVAVAGAWGVQTMRVADAESLLVTEDAETSRLTEQTNELQPVKAFVAGVEQQKLAVSGAMGTEIYFSKVFEAMSVAAPDGVVLDSLVVVLAPPPPAPVPAPAPAEGSDKGEDGGQATPAPAAPATPPLCPGPDPFQTREVVACITLSGSAGSRADVGAFVVALGADDSFVEPFISTTTTSDASRVTFSGSVGLSEKVFSGRFADLDAWLTGKD